MKFGGRRKNNLLKIDPPPGFLNRKALYEPADPNQGYKVNAYQAV